jgi:DNA-binding transcriptional regulator LsrR (DeoR family)
MAEKYGSEDRAALLADVAQMYYLEDKSQAEIARVVGVTRSMVSRMLKEARDKGIVEVRIHRSLRLEPDLETALVNRFKLKEALVVGLPKASDVHLLDYLGLAGKNYLKPHLVPDVILGLSWGTSVSAVINRMDMPEPLQCKIVQLVGALGAQNNSYDGHALVSQLVEKLGGEGYYLNAPFLCTDSTTAESVLETPSIKEAISWGRKAQIALVGVGSTKPNYSSYYLAGYVSRKELNQLRKEGAVGDVCGLHFDIDGRDVCGDFCERMVTIRKVDLLAIPLRLGIAGGEGKVEAILGALRGGYINVLVTDGTTARNILALTGE